MRRLSEKCIFCGARPVTGEHLFSHWTHKLMPPGRMPHYIWEKTNERPAHLFKMNHKRGGDIRDLKIYCVCGPNCNNGWMREHIENPAIDVLSELMSGNDFRLLPQDQRKVAAWAALKLIISEYDREGTTTVHHQHRKWLMKHHIPPLRGWTVWIGHYRRGTWKAHLASAIFLVKKDDAPRREATFFNGRAFTIVLNQLFVHVVHAPTPRFIRNLHFRPPDGGAVVRIWPPATDVSVVWPPPVLSDRDADYVSARVMAYVSALMKRSTAAAPSAAR